jgi:hypothetical protein
MSDKVGLYCLQKTKLIISSNFLSFNINHFINNQFVGSQ